MKISLNNISFAYDKTLFQDLKLEFENGLNVIKAGSGAGKTSLLRLIMGLETPAKGTIKFNDLPLNGDNVQEIRQHLSWVPQSFKQFRDVEVSFLLEQLNLDIGEFVQNLKFFNLEYTNKSLSEYSVGEIQRIFLSIAKSQNRELLILDEPSSALDKTNRMQLIQYLKSHQGNVICVSHDEDIIEIGDKIIELDSQ